ncbi:hypothetical protein GQ42DRAFT_164092 [Ramicandelaber brevisporus]|nr:hypothetical protein GQ42DRAFT_164092 [Ramicandelaber brevisporus]
MKVVALISGGKDSTFNMMECVRHGHEIVALANARPIVAAAPDSSKPEGGETDSYLFQTVGHDAIECIAECLDLPLYRRFIHGTAVDQSLEYQGVTANDETEDLYVLLKEVIDNHPDVEGVSVGAIFSSYQGNRVQNVCDRLGLKMLPYLWQRDQKELLKEMIDAGVDAILIKVAAFGLHPDKHLGKTIKEMYPLLVELSDKYGVHVCGEGGEYESLVLDCPLYKKKRIEIVEKTVILHSNDMYSPVAYLRLDKLQAVPK